MLPQCWLIKQVGSTDNLPSELADWLVMRGTIFDKEAAAQESGSAEILAKQKKLLAQEKRKSRKSQQSAQKELEDKLEKAEDNGRSDRINWPKSLKLKSFRKIQDYQ